MPPKETQTNYNIVYRGSPDWRPRGRPKHPQVSFLMICVEPCNNLMTCEKNDPSENKALEFQPPRTTSILQSATSCNKTPRHKHRGRRPPRRMAHSDSDYGMALHRERFMPPRLRDRRRLQTLRHQQEDLGDQDARKLHPPLQGANPASSEDKQKYQVFEL